jgi:hypothetical protein
MERGIHRYRICVGIGYLAKVWPEVLTDYRPGILWHILSLLGLLPSRERINQHIPKSRQKKKAGSTELAIPEEMLIKLLLCLSEYRALLRKSPRNRGIIEQEVGATSALLVRMELERQKRKRKKVEEQNDYYTSKYGVSIEQPGRGGPKC